MVLVIGGFLVNRSPARFRAPASTKVSTNYSPQPSGASQPPGVSRLVSVGASAPNNTATGAPSGGQADPSTAGQKTRSSDIGPQYLAKTLKVDLNVKDTRK